MRVYAVQGNIPYVTKKKCSETYPRRELHTRTELVEEADDFVDICLRLAIGRHTTGSRQTLRVGRSDRAW